MHICYYYDYLLAITLLPPSINLIGWPSCTPAVFSMIKKWQRTMQLEEDVNYFGRSMFNSAPVLSCGKAFAHLKSAPWRCTTLMSKSPCYFGRQAKKRGPYRKLHAAWFYYSLKYIYTAHPYASGQANNQKRIHCQKESRLFVTRAAARDQP